MAGFGMHIDYQPFNRAAQNWCGSATPLSITKGVRRLYIAASSIHRNFGE